MRNHFFNLFTSNLKVSARIKNSRVCLHYAAYTCGKSKTYVRVDIDFADSHRSSATEKLFRNTLCAVEIAAAFDAKTKKEEASDAGKPIYPMCEFERFCLENDIRIGVITVPKTAAQEVADIMVESNIGAIWSFAPTAIKVPDNVLVEHENLALSLAHLDKQF